GQADLAHGAGWAVGVGQGAALGAGAVGGARGAVGVVDAADGGADAVLAAGGVELLDPGENVALGVEVDPGVAGGTLARLRHGVRVHAGDPLLAIDHEDARAARVAEADPQVLVAAEDHVGRETIDGSGPLAL